MRYGVFAKFARSYTSGGVLEQNGAQQAVGLVDSGHLLCGAFAARLADVLQPVGMPLANLTPVRGADLLARACRGGSEQLVGAANGHVVPRLGEGLRFMQCRILPRDTLRHPALRNPAMRDLVIRGPARRAPALLYVASRRGVGLRRALRPRDGVSACDHIGTICEQRLRGAV